MQSVEIKEAKMELLNSNKHYLKHAERTQKQSELK